MESIVLSWSLFKAFIDDHTLAVLLRHVCDGDNCKVWIQLSGKVIETCVIVGTADHTDFLTNYESGSNLEITGRF